MDHRPTNIQDIDDLVAGYVACIERLAALGADDLLQWLATGGRRWTMFIECELPLRRSAIVRVSENRHMGVGESRTGVFGLSLDFLLALNDAKSVHIRAILEDHATVIHAYSARRTTGAKLGVPVYEDARATDEAFGVYVSAPLRPDQFVLRLSLRPSPRLRQVIVTTGVLLLSGTGYVIAQSKIGPEVLAVVALPLSIAATFVLTREPSPLSAQLLRRSHMGIMLLLGLFWLVVLVRLPWETWDWIDRLIEGWS